MPILFCADRKTFHLRGASASYIIKLLDDGRLCHLYYGAAVDEAEQLDYLLRPCRAGYSADGELSSATVPFEYPSFGMGDLREPCLVAQNAAGQYCADVRYVSHEIVQGKPMPQGLPATFSAASEQQDACETLILTCEDAVLGLEIKLFYSVFAAHNAVARRVTFCNQGQAQMVLTRAFSGCLELPDAQFDMLTFNGAWARERKLHRAPLHPGRQGVFSRSGCSSHIHNPLVVLQRSGGGEEHGEAYAANLVYSGNFNATAEVSYMDTTRLVMGVDAEMCSFPLAVGETLELPELVLSYAQNGTGELSRGLHDFYSAHLVRKSPLAQRPVLINNWEATYFDFTQEKLARIMRDAAAVGVDLFVLDDGWFGKRNDDTSSLGDWFVNREKLPGGMEGLCEEAQKNGLKLGLWIEPESINEDSELYRAHPDYCIHIPQREPTRSRQQLLADISRPEVRDAIYSQIKKVLQSAPIAYVKWDMNRPMTQPGGAGATAQSRYAFDYILGLYDLLDRFCTDFPHILLEGCAGGGARFDPGMLYYCPQIWASDDTDASARLDIQLGTAFAYPVCTIGSHVSIVPNHQTGRVISMETRFAVALCGTFGYELDPAQLAPEELAQMPGQIEQFRRYEALIANGDYYRFVSPQNDADDCCFGFIAKDKSQALVIYVQRCRRANTLPKLVRLAGFAPEKAYRETKTGAVFTGAALRGAGYPLGVLEGDFAAKVIAFEAVE